MYLLSSIENTLENPRWNSSAWKSVCVVISSSEERARNLAAIHVLRFLEKLTGGRAPTPDDKPWYDRELVKCTEIAVNERIKKKVLSIQLVKC